MQLQHQLLTGLYIICSYKKKFSIQIAGIASDSVTDRYMHVQSNYDSVQFVQLRCDAVLTLCETQAHAGEEQKKEKSLELHGCLLTVRKKHTEWVMDTKHLLQWKTRLFLFFFLSFFLLPQTSLFVLWGQRTIHKFNSLTKNWK